MKNVLKGLFAGFLCLLGSSLFAQVGIIIPGQRATSNGPFVVRFTSDIAGAPVFINGQYTNTMNFTTRLPGGRYDIRVTAPGHPDWHQQVIIQNDTTINADFGNTSSQPPVPPANYTVRLSANIEGVHIFVDGRPVGREMQLPPGRYRFRVERPGYRPWERSMDIDGDRDLQASLEPDPAVLMLEMELNGRVEWRIDGRVHWTERHNPQIEIAPGPHEVVVTTGAFRTRLHVDLAPGRVYVLKPGLTLEESRRDHRDN
ncbi:MAG: PEGA domain-containing protein [Spirochaetales bacterium]|nr:PEGA domain-containing protein [Spirochaetales bacterium]